MMFRVLDIETVPDASVWTPGNPKWSWGAGFHATPGRICLSPSEAVLVRDDPFPPPQAHRVVAISWVDVALDVQGTPRYRLESMGSECRWSLRGSPDEERDLLRSFGESLQGMSSGGDLNLVTWNGRTFDLPVIAMRSLLHGVPCKWYYESKDMRYRFSAQGHLDLMDFLGDYGAARSMKLGDVARLIGLPGKFGEVTGSSVDSVYRETLGRAAEVEYCEGRMLEVGRYCLRDSIQTAVIFLRSRFHLGKIDRDEYHRCLDTFALDPRVGEAIQVDWGAVRVPGAGDAATVREGGGVGE